MRLLSAAFTGNNILITHPRSRSDVLHTDRIAPDLGRVATRSLLLAFTFTVGLAHAQVPDPSRRATDVEQHDSSRFDHLMEMAGAALESAPDSAYAYCLRAEALARSTGRQDDAGEIQGWLAYLDEQQGRIESALRRYRISLSEADRLNDTSGIATVLNNMAAIYKDQGRITESLDAHGRSLALRRAIGDSAAVATSLNNIGLIYQDQGRLTEALDHYDQALELYETTHDVDGTGTVLHNIASVFREQDQLDQALVYLQRALTIHESSEDRFNMAYTLDAIGDVLVRTGQSETAQEHYQRALRMRLEVGDPRGQGYSRMKLGDLSLAGGDPSAALIEFARALDLFTTSDDKRGRCTALYELARAQEALGMSDAAVRYGSDALTLARELGHAALQRDAAGLLAKAHRSAGRWRDALLMSDLFFAMRDSVRSDENRRRSIRQEFQYDYRLKEAKLMAEQEKKDALSAGELRRKEVQRNALLGFAAFGIVFAVVDMRRRRRIRAEHERSNALLLNILPAEVADELKAKGHAEAKHFDNVTILFTDFKGFTEASEKLSPQELVEELNTCFKAFDGIITARGIEKIKTIGDAYMCVGGLPDPTSSTPAGVVHAALEMQAFMIARKKERDAQSIPAFEMRVGIHSGPVVAGIVGVKKFQYDIWGDTVNTASRMESSGEVGQVNISEATYALVKNETGLTFTPRGKVQAKGKGEMEMYFVGNSRAANRPTSAHR